ncbi:hypothetical protein [Lentibacillus salinarum]|uniref:Uncharacterized protein n=1 Tax=Lentibacillus salinarum TaxID=446820 RepID=A0ABW3ZY01_9BACI
MSEKAFNMGLKQALATQEQKYPVEECPECGFEIPLKSFPVALYRITIWDFPMYKCQCGFCIQRGIVEAAIKSMQKQHNLHGGYYIEQLLEIEVENIK